ncbi:TPA: glycine rich domain-containing protein [Clostridioides difficile]
MQTEWNFGYTGAEQSIILPNGRYRLECWGAGANSLTNSAYESYSCFGGYSKGELTLEKETTLHIFVGQYSGNFNGGGSGKTGTGGGATDIRLVGGSWDNEQGLLSRIIVAGGAGAGSGRGYAGSHGGGIVGNNGDGSDNYWTPGATQTDGGRGQIGSLSGSFGKGSRSSADMTNAPNFGGGGGWFGGAGSGISLSSGGGGSGYVLTKDSYKPVGYTPTNEYWLENTSMTVGGNNINASHGKVKITLLQALPFLNISSYNSTTATFKADHTDPTLLTKIEYFIDDVLKETITTDLTTEKTINYTLEDNALHTLKIVVTDSNNATAEKVLSISKNIMPLPENVNLQDISSKLIEVNAGFKVGKTSIINTLALKNIEASLNNTLVELSEKIKVGFDSGDASLQNLIKQLTQANNTINQLNTKYKYASGTTVILKEVKGTVIPFDVVGYNYREEYKNWINVSNLGFLPNIFISFEKHKTSNSYPTFYRNLIIACRGVFEKDFSAVLTFSIKTGTGGGSQNVTGDIFEINKETPYIDGRGVYLPASYQDVYTSFDWYAIKFK